MEKANDAAASCAATVDGASAAATCAEEVNAAAATPTVGATPVLTAAAATSAEESTLELIDNTNVPVVLNGALRELNKAQCDSWRSPWRLENS